MNLDLKQSGPWIGVAGLFTLLWVSVSTMLYAPWWGVFAAALLLIPQVKLMAAWARKRPTWCPWIPIVGLLLWFCLVGIGVQYWDWRI